MIGYSSVARTGDKLARRIRSSDKFVFKSSYLVCDKISQSSRSPSSELHHRSALREPLQNEFENVHHQHHNCRKEGGREAARAYSADWTLKFLTVLYDYSGGEQQADTIQGRLVELQYRLITLLSLVSDELSWCDAVWARGRATRTDEARVRWSGRCLQSTGR